MTTRTTDPVGDEITRVIALNEEVAANFGRSLPLSDLAMTAIDHLVAAGEIHHGDIELAYSEIIGRLEQAR